MDIQVNPELVQTAYRQMLSDANSQVALLQAAATGLQQEKDRLEKENKQLRQENGSLRQQTGRKDGVPREEPSS